MPGESGAVHAHVGISGPFWELTCSQCGATHRVRGQFIRDVAERAQRVHRWTFKHGRPVCPDHKEKQ
jgi:uncharacterized C2H2 Zn-finger protein